MFGQRQLDHNILVACFLEGCLQILFRELIIRLRFTTYFSSYVPTFIIPLVGFLSKYRYEYEYR
jgi:hypothetical protein